MKCRKKCEEADVLRQAIADECPMDELEEKLWDCIVAFKQKRLYTASGLPYTYDLKVGRNGQYTKEMFVNRMKKSKSLTWTSLLGAFKGALERNGEVVVRPKALGDIRGISYIYPLFWHWRLIEVPEKSANNMLGKVTPKNTEPKKNAPA